MNNRELFHRWANRVKDHGKSGNVFYEGPVLYSYGRHFPLAVLTGKAAPDGKEIVLVNSRTYSSTTAKHKGQAVRASSHMVRIYVPHPSSTHAPHLAENLERLNKETATACAKIKDIRSCVDYREQDARNCEQAARLYRRTFLKGRGHVHALPKDFDAILTAAREREERHTTKSRERDAETARLRALSNVEKIAAWRDGESVSLPWGLPCMLRMDPSNALPIVQTSQGVEVPLSHARRVYGAVLNVMASGVDFESNGHTIPVGVYKVDKIGADGTLRAGCHMITFEEIDRFAGERGWK